MEYNSSVAFQIEHAARAYLRFRAPGEECRVSYDPRRRQA